MLTTFKKLMIFAPALLLAGCFHTTDTAMTQENAATTCEAGVQCTDIRKSVGLHRDISHIGIFRPAPRPTPNSQ